MPSTRVVYTSFPIRSTRCCRFFIVVARAARTASSTTISRWERVNISTLDNYHGLFRFYRAEDGTSTISVLAGPSVPEVTRRFSWLTGGQAFAPRWTLASR